MQYLLLLLLLLADSYKLQMCEWQRSREMLERMSQIMMQSIYRCVNTMLHVNTSARRPSSCLFICCWLNPETVVKTAELLLKVTLNQCWRVTNENSDSFFLIQTDSKESKNSKTQNFLFYSFYDFVRPWKH